MYILEQRSSCGTSEIHPSWPRSEHVLNPALAPSYEHATCCHAQPDVLLFMTTVMFHPTSSAIWVASHKCTSKHHNSNIWYKAHTYIHHTITTIHVLLYIFHSPGQAGCPPFHFSVTFRTPNIIHVWLVLIFVNNKRQLKFTVTGLTPSMNLVLWSSDHLKVLSSEN